MRTTKRTTSTTTTTKTTTTTTSTTPMTVLPTTTYGGVIEHAYDDADNDPQTESDCDDFYWYNDDETRMTRDECLDLVNG